ncbi:MAG: tRNA-dihydrouridine synthase family protein [Lentisphaerae bacterium]|nr:tRNA-dihydrouridine synthase family protein [Lentisphaerota bacterium]MBT4818626.1 tRNA-dihydrouridine synthase family protein [Lentisphaerota bacterium]MBT5609534.1 tRNA-dihydrouridine synthase family protein [Lentisphaerota bacterium]MBT7058440.1 tRNA-dihydrouridine synthase family protein [Lentisphaerota bacterium]MBT7843149.1 tRNA-dihydrouridine synthase family protein [Lentisphaerota bacterium]
MIAASHSLPAAWLEPLALTGDKALPNHIVPGPMEGVTEGSFCDVFSRHELVRCWITPFIRVSTGVPRRVRLRRRIQPFLDTGLPIIVQLMGLDTERLSETARRLAEMGVAGVDLNCACPAPLVLRNGAGGVRLQHPEWIRRALCELREACPNCGVSVKLRTGFESPSEFSRIADAVRGTGVDFVILHFRTVRELYRPVSDGCQRLTHARDLLPETTLLGSGDLFSVEAALRMYRDARLDGVAPARGMLKEPSLLRKIEDACCGRKDAPAVSRIAMLRDIAAGSGRSDAAYNGFVIKLAGWFFGRDSDLFRQVVACGSLARTVAFLRELTDG